MRKRIYELIDEKNKEGVINKGFDNFIIALIFIDLSAIILESFEGYGLKYEQEFWMLELISVAIFTIEYILRIATAKYRHPEKKGWKAARAFMLSPIGIIDLLAILPTLLPLFFIMDLRFIRVLRVFRILRLLKINRYNKSLHLIVQVFKERKADLLMTLFITFILLVFASFLMYNIEKDVQPEAFPNILATFWWAIATLTTVGYGDVYPITALGKLLSGVIALLGVGLVALPTGILSSAFIDKLSIKKAGQKKCPTCGNPVEDH
ncbi:MAG: voltage-gated potassium channel [Luteibaculaceae bacterium]